MATSIGEHFWLLVLAQSMPPRGSDEAVVRHSSAKASKRPGTPLKALYMSLAALR